MYAIFADPTVGQEDVAGNCTWGPSSTPPWGTGWRAKSEWPDGLRDDLPDDWTPTPAAEEVLAAAKTAKEATIKTLLAETDYKALKHSDGAITDDEYASTKTYRAALRTAYNSVEAATTVAEVDAVTMPTKPIETTTSV
jgi:hypothetical protein